jgi:hypothetical protein
LKRLGGNADGSYSGKVIVEMSLTELAHIMNKGGYNEVKKEEREAGAEIDVHKIYDTFKRIDDRADTLETVAQQIEEYAGLIRKAGDVVQSAVKVGTTGKGGKR